MGLKWDASRQYRLRPDGKTLTIHFEVYHHRVYNAAAEVMRRYWEAVGVKVELDPSKDDYFVKFPKMEVSGIHLVPALTQTLYMQLAWTTPVWYDWMNTGGKSGVEPPAWAKELIKIGMEDLYKAPTQKEREALGKRAWQLINENLPFIGVVADSKTTNTFSKDLGNVLEAEKLGFSHDTVVMLGDTWYFKTPSRRQ
jgi:peptide/nickel transport system substrate-binding protein